MAVALAYHEIYKFMCRNAFEQMHEHEMAIARYPDDADALEKSMRFNENTLESIFRPLDRLYEHLTRGLTFRLKSKEIDHAVTDIAKTLLDLNSLIEVAKDGNTEYDFTVNI